MSLTSGLRLTVLAGATLPVPLTVDLAERVRSVTVTESDEERSVFSLVLDAEGRAPGSPTPFGAGFALSPFSRVSIVVTFGPLPTVLFDGIVTETRLEPGAGGSGATWVVTGEDLGNLLDREERDVEHPGLDDYPVVLAMLAPYAANGLLPAVTPPPTMDPPLPIDRIPTQHGTDLAHLVALAERHGYVAYATPGALPGTSLFYWGPPVRLGVPQPALAANMGHDSSQTPVEAPVPTRPPLGAVPFAAANATNLRSRRLRSASSNTVAAQAQAQGQVDAASDAVTAEGSADGARYGSVLRSRGLVGLRGVGWENDGVWYCKRVEHSFTMGAYALAFTLTRDGHGATTPVLPRAAS